MQNGPKHPDNAGAASTDYMHLFGLVALGYMWGLMVKAAGERLDEGGASNVPFYEAKLATGRFARIASGADSLMALPAEAF